jgi:hypothetical protein
MYTFGTFLLVVQYDWAAPILMVVKYFSHLTLTNGTLDFVILGSWIIHT